MMPTFTEQADPRAAPNPYDARRNSITQALMNIQNPPPRQMPQMQPRQPVMASPGPPPPQTLPMASGLQAGLNAMTPQGPAPGSPRVPLAQVPQQMMQNVTGAPQRLTSLFTQGATPAAATPADPAQQPPQ